MPIDQKVNDSAESFRSKNRGGLASLIGTRQGRRRFLQSCAAYGAGILLNLSPAFAGSPVPEPSIIEVESYIDKVTVCQNEAIVTRIVDIPNSITQGYAKLIVSGLPSQSDLKSLRVTSDESIEARLERWAPYREPASEVIQRLDKEIEDVNYHLRQNKSELDTAIKQLQMTELRETTTTTNQEQRRVTEEEIVSERNRNRNPLYLYPRLSVTRDSWEQYSASTTIDKETGLGMIPGMDEALAKLLLDSQSELGESIFALGEEGRCFEAKIANF